MNKRTKRIFGGGIGLAIALGVGFAVGNVKKAVTTIAANAATKYALITSTNDLEAGKSYIITDGTSGTVKAVAVTANNNNRKAVDATVSDGKITRGDNIMSFTLGGEAGAWTFHTDNYAGTAGYLASAASGNNNYLRVIDSDSNKATISFDKDSNAAVITIQPHGTRNVVKYNSGSSLFACYSSSSEQNDVYLWKELAPAVTYTASFNANGGTGTMNPVGDLYGPYSLPENGFTAPAGKAFAGWKADNVGDLLAPQASYDVQANVTFYAQWEDTCTVSFSANGGSGEMAPVSDIYGAYSLPDNGFTAPAGKAFIGWKANNAGDLLAPQADYDVKTNVTFFAQWDNIYNVTYTAGPNGSGSFVDADHFAGEYTLLPFNQLDGFAADSGYRFKSYTVGGAEKQPGDVVAINAATAVTVNFEEIGLDTTYDFRENFTTYASGDSWGSYGNHEGLDGKNDIGGDYAATIDLYKVIKQGSTITDMPVIATRTASGYTKVVHFELNELNYKIKQVEVTFAQWGTKKPSVALFKGGDAKGDPLDTATIGTKNTVSVADLNGTEFTIGYCDGADSNVQSGLQSIYITLAPLEEFGTLDHIKVTPPSATKYHVGESYSDAGVKVVAYDGANENTANFKDVTAEAVSSLAGGYQFKESDVPGLDVTFAYQEKEASFHLNVYALAEYRIVTKELDDWSGSYLIVGENKGKEQCAMNGSLAFTDSEKNYKVVEPEDGSITTGQELEFTITKSNDKYYVRGNNGMYIGSVIATSNGMLVSETPIDNTISYADEAVAIVGTNGYSLKLNTTGDRFRYYDGGRVQLYRLVESDAADEYAQTFLDALQCDNTGVNKPSFNKKDNETTWTWALLASEYDKLTPAEKEQFRLGSASESGTNIQKALARYDFIVGKYYTGGLDLSFTDFMNRKPAASASTVSTMASHDNAMPWILGAIAAAGALAVATGTVIATKKRKQD